MNAASADKAVVDTALLSLGADDLADPQWVGAVSECMKRTKKRLYLHFPAFDASTPTDTVLKAWGAAYNALLPGRPRFDLVPLVPAAGWDDAAVDALCSGGEAPPLRLGAREMLGAAPSQGAERAHVDLTATGPTHLFELGAVGGTFDRLHAGHRLLLAGAALCARNVEVGITSDELLAKKSHRDLLESYDYRTAAVIEFMRAVRPGMDIIAGPLSDPNEPPHAATDENIKVLVVSPETTGGAEAIAAHRASLGLGPIEIVVIPVVGGDVTSKLSSSALREADAAATGAARG